MHRSMHVVSPSTDTDIRTITELISPMLSPRTESSLDSFADYWSIEDDADSVVEPSLYYGFPAPASHRSRKISLD